MLERYLLSLGPYAFQAAGTLACLFIFLTLKQEIRRLKSRLDRQQADEATATRDLKLRLEEITLRLRDSEDRAGVLVAPEAPRSGLNLTKRSQAIRMSRRGERAENIAASLSLPRGEVDLLLKVNALTVNSTTF
ncbi:MAG TPA: hypothetical protein VIX89_15800 [Bryobacteraceae bacterium]